jgi:hypothetical protein
VKVMGLVLVVLGLIMLYVGITGSQHNLMAVIEGKTSAAKSGQAINPSGSGTSSESQSQSNTNQGTGTGPVVV